MSTTTTSKLVDVAEIFSGYSFRSKVEDEPGGDLAVIQLKDLENNYSSVNSCLAQIEDTGINSRFYLKHGDLLFIAKGANNYAIEYELTLPKAIAVSAFFIIRTIERKIFPSYLAWYINQTPTQQYLKGNMAGTYIPNINKGTLEQMSVAIPPISIQQKIAAVDRLRKRENFLLTQISQKRGAMVDVILLQAIEN